jgi:hypothetical protein
MTGTVGVCAQLRPARGRRRGHPPRLLDLLSDGRDDEHLERIADRTEQVRRIALITPAMHGRLTPVDERSYRAGLLGSDAAGLFKPE